MVTHHNTLIPTSEEISLCALQLGCFQFNACMTTYSVLYRLSELQSLCSRRQWRRLPWKSSPPVHHQFLCLQLRNNKLCGFSTIYQRSCCLKHLNWNEKVFNGRCGTVVNTLILYSSQYDINSTIKQEYIDSCCVIEMRWILLHHHFSKHFFCIKLIHIHIKTEKLGC